MTRSTILPIPAPLFKTADSLDDAMTRIKASIPITDSNAVHNLVMMYHNTLLQAMEQSNEKL